MAIIKYTGQDEYDVVHESQDCRGWTVTDETGNPIGKVTDLLVDTERMRVDSIVIDGKARIAAEDITLGDKNVLVRGVHDPEAYNNLESDEADYSSTGYPVMDDHSEYRRSGYVSGVTRAAGDQNEVTLPVIEEEMVVGKRTVETGGVNVKTVVTETPVEGTVDLREENVTVERHRVDRPVDTVHAFEEGSFDVTTRAEVPVVSKEARVVEEVVVGKEATAHTETVGETVKRTDVEIEDLGTNDPNRR